MVCKITIIHNVISFIPVLFAHLAMGQQLYFQDEAVDSIFIRANTYADNFRSNQAIEGKTEVICWYYDQSLQQYRVNKYYRSRYKQTGNPSENRVKRKTLKSGTSDTNNRIHLQNLLTALATNANPSQLINQVDTTEIQEYITPKNILKFAKDHRVSWELKYACPSKAEKKLLLKSLQSSDTLKIYLNKRFDRKGYLIITDYSNTFNIWITTEKNNYHFEGKYPNPVKQPWYLFPDAKEELTDENSPTAILNLEINKALIQVLPKNFLFTETISIKALVDDYMMWYFKRMKLTY